MSRDSERTHDERIEDDTNESRRAFLKGLGATTGAAVLGGLGTGSAAASHGSGTAIVEQASSAPTIDGSVDSVWSDANSLSMDAVCFGVSDTSDLDATVRTLWDATNFYVLAEVTDDSSSDDSTDIWKDDSFEVYLDVGDEDEQSYDDDEYLYKFSRDGTEIVEENGKSTSGINVGASETTSGYTLEIEIPWSTVGVSSTSNGDQHGLDFAINDDDDGGGRDGKLGWHEDCDAYKDPSLFGTMELRASDSTAPTAPSNLSSPGHTDTTVDLDWDASSDSGGSGLAQYNVYVDGTKDHQVSAGTTSTTVTGLTSSTSYDFHVTAVDGAGNESSDSNTVTVTTNSSSSADATLKQANYSPNIDGDADSLWSEANDYTVGNVVSGSRSGTSDLSATWWGLWDATNLYLRVKVTDDTLTTDSSTQWEDDSVEIYVDGDNSDGSSYDGTNDFQYLFEYNDSTVYTGTNSVTDTTGVNHAFSDVSGGYQLEVEIPWSTIGVSVSSGDQIGLDVGVNDDDDGGSRDCQILWYDTTGDAYQDPSLFGTAEISSTTAGSSDSTAPTAPSNLSSPSHTDSTVDLDWDASSDTGGSGLDHYNVYVDNTKDHEVVAGTTQTTVDGLSADTSYDFHVTAVDGADNESADSNTVSVTTNSSNGGGTVSEGGPPNQSNWNLVFEDKFDAGSLDTNNWDIGFGWGRTTGWTEEYVADDHVWVDGTNDELVLKISDESNGGKDFTAGTINSQDATFQEYGYWEAKVDVPNGSGLMPAFWGKPNNEDWPPEIDFFEVFGENSDEWEFTVHYDCGSGHQQSGDSVFDDDMFSGFHIIGCEWDENYIKWYLNGQEVRHWDTSMSCVNAGKPFYMMLSCHVHDAAWTGDPYSEDEWPFYYKVDWVRLWDRV